MFRIFALFDAAVSTHWTKRVGHFYLGGSGIAREQVQARAFNEGLGDSGAQGARA